MTLERVKRWQWVCVAVVVGLALWGLRRYDLESLPGETVNAQSDFESGLTERIGPARRFDRVQVWKQSLGGTPVYVVSFRRLSKQLGTDSRLHYTPACYVARFPYEPRRGGIELSTGGKPASVADFLNALHRTDGVEFTHAWWNSYPFAVWFGGALLVIGMVWPCVIDLWYYGRLVRPAEPRIDLSDVRVPNAAKSGTIPADLEELRALDAEMEANLASPGDNAPASSPEQPATAIPAMSAGPLEAVPHLDAPERAFAAKQDDYYPTEKVRKQKS